MIIQRPDPAVVKAAPSQATVLIAVAVSSSLLGRLANAANAPAPVQGTIEAPKS